jgi:hypothetical protein
LITSSNHVIKPYCDLNEVEHCMSFQDYEQFDERECARFEEKFAYWDDLTWGFYIYGTYKQRQNNSDRPK